ncbi:hypothetical protein PM082_017356 [Marasmius tenuissimus]|nr:hypothetical protein PM082_017356 [Marasmius tenuissimus]
MFSIRCTARPGMCRRNAILRCIPGPLQNDTATWLPISSAFAVGWIGSIQLFLELFLMDRGYFRRTVVSGCVIAVFSLFMLSLSGQYYYQVWDWAWVSSSLLLQLFRSVMLEVDMPL